MGSHHLAGSLFDAAPLAALPDLALRGTLLLVLVFAAAALLRRASAAMRHLVWSGGLAALLALPTLSATLPWRLAVLPGRAVATPSAGGRATAADRAVTAPTVEAPATEAPATAAARGQAGALAGEWAGSEPVASEPVAYAGAGLQPQRWWASLAGLAALATSPAVLVGLWLAVAALLAARLLTAVFGMWLLVRRAAAVDAPGWGAALRSARRRLHVRRDIRLVRSDDVEMPMAAGLLRPTIILPAAADAWPADRREAVLLHELAHVERRDLWSHLLARLACAVYWFHPLAWAAARRLRAESERACDDRVLGAGTPASDYAEHLLQIVRAAGRGRSPALALPMAQRSDFEGRLIAILEPAAPRHAPTRRAALATALAVALFAVPVAVLAPSRAEGATPPRRAARAAADGIALHVDAERPGVTGGVRAGAARALAATRNALTQAVVAGTQAAEWLPGVGSGGGAEPQDAAPAPDAGEDAPEQQAPAGVTSALVDALSDRDATVRLEAVRALGTLKAPRAADALGALLGDASRTMRMAAVQSLGEIEDPRSVRALSEALRTDTDPEVRKMAAWALGEIESPDGIPALADALRGDKVVEVRRMAVWALGEIEDRSAVPALGAALRDQDEQIRLAALQALGEIEDPGSVDLITPFLKNDDVEVRLKAAWALGEIESADAIDALAGVARDSDPRMREMVIWALGEIEDREGAPILATALRDASVGVRRKAAWALGEIDELGSAPRELVDALKDADRGVRLAAAHALGEIQDPAAATGLAALARDASDAELRRTAVHALAEIGGVESVEVLVALLKDADPEVRRMAARALGKNRD